MNTKCKKNQQQLVKIFYMGILCIALKERNIKRCVQNCHSPKSPSIEKCFFSEFANWLIDWLVLIANIRRISAIQWREQIVLLTYTPTRPLEIKRTFLWKIRLYVQINEILKRYIESNTGKSARQGNLRHPRVSEISLSCTFCRCLLLFLTFISCFYCFYFSLLSAVFSFVFVYVLLADDHVNNVSYFPFMSIKKLVPYFCVLREGYHVIIWLIVRMCVFIKDWKLIYNELFISKRKSMDNCVCVWGEGAVDINCTACICR